MAVDSIHLQKEVRKFCPNCPPRVLELLLSILAEPSASLVRRAEKSTAKHYGQYNIIESTSTWAVSLAVLNPRRSMSRHIHRIRRELAYVRCGVLSMGIADEIHRLEAGQSICSLPGVPHQVANDEDELLEIIELVVPPEWEDKVVLSTGR